MKPHEFKVKKLADLTGYESNSRTHSNEQIGQIEKSITTFGFTNPVLIDEKNGIIAGHGRVLAAANLGMKDVPCMVIDGLDQHSKAALVITDNKLALNAGWNYDALKSEIGFLQDVDFDLDLLGFDEDELGDILNGWDSDIDVAARDGENLDGIMATIKVKVDQDNSEKAEDIVKNALTDAGIEFE